MTMQKSLCALVACLGALAVASPQSASASVTFYDTQAAFQAATTTHLLDDYGSSSYWTSVGNGFAENGVTYSGLASDWPANVLVIGPGYTNFGSGVGVTAQNIVTSYGDENFVASFSTPYTAVGFDAFFADEGTGVLSVLGAHGSLLGELDFGRDPATGLADEGYLGFTSTTPIWGFHWDTVGDGNEGTGISDLSVSGVGAAGIPEAASWELMIMGVGIVGWSKRRRRRNCFVR